MRADQAVLLLNCKIESQACFQEAWREARIEYRAYVREMEEAGEEIVPISKL